MWTAIEYIEFFIPQLLVICWIVANKTHFITIYSLAYNFLYTTLLNIGHIAQARPWQLTSAMRSHTCVCVAWNIKHNSINIFNLGPILLTLIIWYSGMNNKSHSEFGDIKLLMHASMLTALKFGHGWYITTRRFTWMSMPKYRCWFR